MSDADTTVIEQPAEPAAVSRRPAVLVLAALGGILLAALTWFVLLQPLLVGAEDGADADEGPADPPPSADVGPDDIPDELQGEVPDTEDALEDLPTVTYEVFLARDPFEPVIPEDEPEQTTTDPADEATGPPESTDGGPGTPPEPGSPGTPTPEPGTPDPGGPSPSPSPPGNSNGTSPDRPNGNGSSDGRECRTGRETVCDGRVLSLVEIRGTDRPLAVIQVDSTIYEVEEGQVFARNFLVQSIGAARVTLVFGDEVVTLEEGDRVLK